MRDSERSGVIRARLGNLRQRRFGALLGKSGQAVSKWELGKGKVPLGDIARRLHPFGVNGNFVIGLSEDFLRPGFTDDQVREAVAVALSQIPAKAPSRKPQDCGGGAST